MKKKVNVEKIAKKIAKEFNIDLGFVKLALGIYTPSKSDVKLEKQLDSIDNIGDLLNFWDKLEVSVVDQFLLCRKFAEKWSHLCNKFDSARKIITHCNIPNQIKPLIFQNAFELANTNIQLNSLLNLNLYNYSLKDKILLKWIESSKTKQSLENVFNNISPHSQEVLLIAIRKIAKFYEE